MGREGLPRGSVVKNLPANVGDMSLTPEPGGSPAEGNGSPLQYSYPENPMGRGAWWATIYGVTSRWTQLRDKSFHFPRQSAKKKKSKMPDKYFFIDYM